MSQSYATIQSTDTLTASRAVINSNFDALLSNFSGTSFPTSNLAIGMECYRTDLNKNYKLTAIGPAVWTVIQDMAQVQIGRTDADARYMMQDSVVRAEVYAQGKGSGSNDYVGTRLFDNGGQLRWYLYKDSNHDLAFNRYNASSVYIDTPLAVVGGVLKSQGSVVWTAGNGGSGSGLDADLVRGITPGYIGAALLASATQGAAQTALGVAPAQVGSILFMYAPGSFVVSGYVPMNGLTIGDASSSATNRANADTQALFTHLWTYTNLAVTGGRGASAAADWAAHKAIATPDFRGRAPVVLDDMGTSAAGRIPTGLTNTNDPTIVGSYGGVATVTLDTTMIPAHTHTVNDPGHTHSVNSIPSTLPLGAYPAAGQTQAGSGTTGTAYTGITVNNTGGGAAHTNMQPFMMVGGYIKL